LAPEQTSRRGKSQKLLPPCRALQRADNLGCRSLQVRKITGGAFIDRHSSPDPQDIDRSMDTLAVPQRNSDTCEPIVFRIAVEAADETWSARAISFRTRLRENLVDLLLIAR
jgi:hypothetical protein